MKLLIVCVNYNSYSELTSYVTSINFAVSKVRNIQVDISIADNSTSVEEVTYDSYSYVKVSVTQTVINSIANILDYDYVAISNVDITVAENFFINLENIIIAQDVAWIAPKIFSKVENRDRNPKVISRYSKKKLQLLYYMYKIPVLYYLYTMSAYQCKKLQVNYPEIDIYAGHGSFILLTRSFFEYNRKIEYPIFLFGEELFLAEIVMKAGKKVRYVPNLVIEDNEHISTSTLKKKTYFKYNRESIKYILDTFYHE